MISKSIGILVTTYNDGYMLNACLRSVYEQDYNDLHIICVDDGSEKLPQSFIDFDYSDERLVFLNLPHGERAIAREAGIKYIKQRKLNYIMFIDSDMILSEGLVGKSIAFAEEAKIDGLIFPELAFSNSNNYWSRVKVFERNLYQAHYDYWTPSSIEAARMWKVESFLGFEEGLKAFEEIQPTIKAYNAGMIVRKVRDVYIKHDEKHVTYANLMAKKQGYFVSMGEHESVTIYSMISKFYFFRKQLYFPKNLIQYVKHPTLWLGVMWMYTSLTFLGIKNIFLKKKGM